MNTDHKATKVVQCIKCDHTYMVVGDTAIRLAFPRPPTLNYQAGAMPFMGTCPIHRQGE